MFTSYPCSVGSAGITGFEDSMNLLFGTRSHTFDPTLPFHDGNKLREKGYIEFYEWGLTGTPNTTLELLNFKAHSSFVSPTAEFKHIDEIMSALNHSFVDVFKIDCEGCEESFIPYLAKKASREKPLFGQMLIEFHKYANLPFFAIFFFFLMFQFSGDFRFVHICVTCF